MEGIIPIASERDFIPKKMSISMPHNIHCIELQI
jgi:hypothetical protein